MKDERDPALKGHERDVESGNEVGGRMCGAGSVRRCIFGGHPGMDRIGTRSGKEAHSRKI